MDRNKLFSDLISWKNSNLISERTNFGDSVYKKVSILCDGMGDEVGIDDVKKDTPVKRLYFINQQNNKLIAVNINDITDYRIFKKSVRFFMKNGTVTIR